MLITRAGKSGAVVVLKTVIGLTGMPGSGKTVISNLARDLGIPVIIMGDVIREEVARRGLNPTPENLGEIMLKLRADFGDAVVAERCASRIGSLDSPVVLVEGIRALDEVLFFRKIFPRFELVAIHSSPRERFERLRKRKRSDDSQDQEVIEQRDRRELQVGIGSVIALADHVFVNDGKLDVLKNEIRSYLLMVISCARSRNKNRG